MCLPFNLVYTVGHTMEVLAAWINVLLGTEFVPLLNRTEVNKCAVTHYFKV